MRGSIQALEPDTESHKLLYDHTLKLLHELADARHERLLQANAGLPAILWAVPLIGGVIVVAFTYVFGLQSSLVHTLMVGGPDPDHRTGALYKRRPRLPVQGRFTSWP